MSYRQLSLAGFAALVLACAALGAEDEPKPLGTDESPDKKYALTLTERELSVERADLVKVKTAEGEEKEVALRTKVWSRKADAPYTGARFVTDKSAAVKAYKTPLVAVTSKEVSLLDGTTGKLIWSARHDGGEGAAQIQFTATAVRVTISDVDCKFDAKTGERLKD